MNIDKNHYYGNPVFGASFPIYYYAKDKAGKVYRVMKPENIKKCNSYIIRNLTGSIKEKNNKVVELFKNFDSEYKLSGKVRSVYDTAQSLVYLVTGKKDCEAIKKMGQVLGEIKSESIRRTKTTKTFEVIEAAKNFFKKSIMYVRRPDVRKRTKEGENMVVHAVFDAEYKKNGEVKGFKFSDIAILKENEVFAL